MVSNNYYIMYIYYKLFIIIIINYNYIYYNYNKINKLIKIKSQKTFISNFNRFLIIIIKFYNIIFNKIYLEMPNTKLTKKQKLDRKKLL